MTPKYLARFENLNNFPDLPRDAVGIMCPGDTSAIISRYATRNGRGQNGDVHRNAYVLWPFPTPTRWRRDLLFDFFDFQLKPGDKVACDRKTIYVVFFI